MMMSTPGAQQLFYLLPVYLLLCLRLSAGALGNTERSAPWERQGIAANVSSRPIVTRPLTRPYKDRPLLAPTSERKQKGETQRAGGEKIETERRMMKWLQNDRRKGTLT